MTAKITNGALALTAGIMAVAGVLTGCGGTNNSSSGSSSIPNVRNYQGTQSPGDPWHWTITSSTSTWSATNSKTGYTYSGTWSTLSSGFKQLVITQTTDTHITPPVNMFGLEVPNTMFVAKPVGVNTKPVIAASLGTSPTGTNLTYNYIHIPELGYVPDTGDAYGTLNFNVNANTWNGTLTRFRINGAAINPNLPFALTNNGGLLSSGTVTGGITSSGVVMVDLGPNSGGAVAIQAASSPVSLGAVASGTYLGVHVNPADGAFLVWGSAASGNGITIGTYSNVVNNVKNSAYGTVTFTGQPSPGQLTATVNYVGGGSAPAVFVANQVNGKYILFGIVRHQLGTAHFVLVQQ